MLARQSAHKGDSTMITHYNINLRGGICGNIWQPGIGKCGMPLNVNLSREIARIYSPDDSRVTLRDAIELIMCENGGDFQSAKLTGDTEICVSSAKISDGRMKKHSRYWPITAFPSIADYVDEDAFSFDFCGE